MVVRAGQLGCDTLECPIRAAVVVPIAVEDRIAGTLAAVTSTEPGPGLVQAALETARWVSTQLELAELDQSRARLVRAEVRALRAVPLLASLETARLKLLAFTGQRVAFAPGDVLMRQGDEAHDALVILSGQAEVSITGDGGPLSLGLTEPNAIVGEMGALTRSRRLAARNCCRGGVDRRRVVPGPTAAPGPEANDRAAAP